jgi:hypothetical protein
MGLLGLEEFNMKRIAALSLVAIALTATPCHAQILQKLEQGLLGGQQQGMPGQPTEPVLVGTVNLPQGQYMMTNVQSGQAFYVTVQNGQMYFSQPPAPPMMQPGMMPPGQMMPPGSMMPQQQQQPGMGGFLRNVIQKELAPQQQPQQQFPNQ